MRPYQRFQHHDHSSVGCKKGHRSIFLRLFFTLIAAMFLIQLIVGGAFSILFGRRTSGPVQDNIRQYATLTARELGSPPDTLLASQIAQERSMEIRYESGDLAWTTHPNDETRFPFKHKGFGHLAAWRQFTEVDNGDGSRYLIRWRISPFREMHGQFLVGLLILVTLIFTGIHFYMRKILRPIKSLRKGVDEISAGNLNVKIPVEHEDELGCLTEAFNDMARRIKQMLESRDQLLLDVSHELRSPLTRMKVALEMMPDSDKKESILADIIELETMITEILESERLNNGHTKLVLEDTDLMALIRSVAKDFKDRPPGMVMDKIPDKVNLRIDPRRIRMVLSNVLENAIKYARPDSKPVRISIDADKKVTVQIRDDGIGIPESDLPRLFEPFYRVDRSRSKKTGGYGLGLSLCKKIMQAHDGDIHIKNNPERGITVTLIFNKK